MGGIVATFYQAGRESINTLHTLKELGHCTLSFKGGDAAERPGCIMLQGDEPLTKDDIKAGTTIEIY